MNTVEIIDRLCAVTEEQARIIREQAYVIENWMAVDDQTKKKFEEMRKPIEAELDSLEYKLRRFV